MSAAASYIAISTRCAHLGCPVRWVGAAERFVCPCHGGVYDFQGLVVGGPPVRPLDRFVTRVKAGQVQIGPRYSVNSHLKRFSPATRASTLDGLWQYLCPKRSPSRRPPDGDRDSKAPVPGRRKPQGRRRRGASGKNGAGREAVKDQAAEVGTGIVGWVDERTGASGFLRGFLFRKVPKGTNWFYTLGSATMFAFLSQAVTGVFLAMYYDPNPTRAYDSVQHITNDVFLGAARARHASLGRDA